MELDILPHVGVGSLRFGMTVDDVRRNVPAPAVPFLKGPAPGHPTDAFDPLGLHVFYRGSGTCEAIEMGPPANPTLRGQPLVGVAFSAVEQFLRGLDGQAAVDESGLTSTALGVAIYCPGHDENAGLPVEGVLVFQRGYYDAD